ncbi:leucine-rich repeat receptor-like protein kinase IMK2 [Vitis vinifera]|uniref:Leucine-rich repeat receptor-like protein kinase IMK2 n=1 Tax=Vitis vinifera TaxID=29760 RepID=A0A438FTC3_VITVI|nr:leucine-rich repeat receptor-like protein kinase IMK2 [Vitis vinifera]
MVEEMGDLCLISDNKKKKWKSHPRDKFKSFLFNHLFLLVQVLLLTFPLVSGHPWDGVVVTQADYQALKALKHEFVDLKGVLSTWNDSVWKLVLVSCKHSGGLVSMTIFLLALSLRSLGFLPNLRGVYLFNNRLSGSVPPSIGYCLLLQTLDVSNNLLTGTIPPSLANSTKLYRLNLSFNSFFGSIPVSLTQSHSLIFLALQHNNLSGSIPNTWGGTGKNVYQLQTLTLDQNRISGDIPISLSKLGKLEGIF